MKRFTTLEEVRQARLPPAIRGALERALACEMEVAGEDYSPDDDGSVWLVEYCDGKSVREALGKDFTELLFESVEHDANQGFFLCRLIRNNQRLDTIVVMDNGLPELWAVTLISQT